MAIKRNVVSMAIVMSVAVAQAVTPNVYIINNTISTSDGFSIDIDDSKTSEYIMAALATINGAFVWNDSYAATFSTITIGPDKALQFKAYNRGFKLNILTFYKESLTGDHVVIVNIAGANIATIKLPSSYSAAQVQKFDFTVGLLIKWLLQGAYESTVSITFPSPPSLYDFNVDCKFEP